MKDKTYIALGINPSGTAVVLGPVRQGSNILTPVTVMLCDIEAKGLTESASSIGRILISALGAFHPEVDDYSIAPEPPLTRQFSTTSLPLDWREMRPERMGLGVSDMTIQPSLVFRAFAGNTPVGQDHIQSLQKLAELGKSVAPSFIGETMLLKLAAMHPDVFRPLFPTMAL
jgi:hypothetical protein